MSFYSQLAEQRKFPCNAKAFQVKMLGLKYTAVDDFLRFITQLGRSYKELETLHLDVIIGTEDWVKLESLGVQKYERKAAASA